MPVLRARRNEKEKSETSKTLNYFQYIFTENSNNFQDREIII